MKKFLFLMVALTTAITAFSQNLAEGKTAKATSGDAANAIDGNTGTRWESSHADDQTWQLDLGEAMEFNTIQIVWEGAYTKTYSIEAGNEVDTDGWLTDGTVIASGVNTGLGNNVTQTLNLENTVTARYIKYHAIDRATQWGNSFYEFRVINAEPSVLTTFTLNASKNFVAKNTGVTLTTTMLDQYGSTMDLTPTFSIEPAEGASITGNTFTATAEGSYTVTASAAEKTATADIIVFPGEKINITTDMVALLNGDCTANGMAAGFDDNEGSVWVYREYPGQQEYEAGFIVDLGAYYTIDFVRMVQEGACSGDYTLYTSEDGSTWNSVFHKTVGGYAWQYDDVVLNESNTNVRFFKFFSAKAANGNTWGVKMAEFTAYGTKTGDIEDDDMPELSDPVVKEEAAEGVTLTLNATDGTATSLTYTVTIDGKNYSTTGNSGENTDITISGLSQNTEYTASVTASDGVNTTEPKTVTFTTLSVEPFDYDSDCNLFKTATKTEGWFYADWEWKPTTAPVVTETDGVYTFNLDHATNERWMAQYSITTDIATVAGTNYDFSTTINVSKDVVINFQLGTGYEYVTRDIALKGGKDYVIRMENFAGVNINNLKLLFDFGGNQADTDVKISKIVVREHDCGSSVEPTDLEVVELTDEGIATLSGAWDIDDFKTLDAETGANAYDFTNVTGLTTGINNQNMAKNPNTMFIYPTPGTFLFNQVVKKEQGGYQGYNIQIIDDFNNREDHSVNTAIAPLTVTSPFFKRVFNAADVWATAVFPWIQDNMPEGLLIYELGEVNENEGVTTLTFEQVATAAPEAGKPYLVHAEAADITMAGGGDQTITWETTPVVMNGVTFTPTFTKMAQADNQYALSGTPTGEVPNFGRNTSFDVPAFRSVITKDGNEAKLAVMFNDATGIHKATAEQLSAVFNIYSIDGKIVKRNASSMFSLAPGAYIVNGKKVVVK